MIPKQRSLGSKAILACSLLFIVDSQVALSFQRQGSAKPAAAARQAAFGGSATAKIRLPSIFGDSMVLQRDRPVPIWGRAMAGEAIVVRIAGKQASANADGDGKWKVMLPALPAGGPHALTVHGSSDVGITLKDVLIGEVWICSGQSNMAMAVRRCADAEQEIAAAEFPDLRLITVKRIATDKPQANFTGSWQACTPETIGSFSGVGYFFGRELHKELDVPIGLINSSVGGTPAESWTSHAALQAQVGLKPLLDRWEQAVTDFDPVKAKQEYSEKLVRWNQLAKRRTAEGQKPPRRPRLAVRPRWNTHYPGMLFNGKIAPLIPFAIRGAIWYQGESNATRAYQYRTIFPTMIRGLEKALGAG